MSSGATVARDRRYDDTTSAGSRISSTLRSEPIHSRGRSGTRCCAMCFWYCSTGPSGHGRVSDSTTRRQSVSPAAITCSRPGWSSPVWARYQA